MVKLSTGLEVEFDEEVVTILMSVLVVGEPEIGKSVVPIFRTKNPTYTIMDLMFSLEFQIVFYTSMY